MAIGIILAICIGLILLWIIVLIVNSVHSCKPHCDGTFWGSKSNDGCGGKCSCKDGGVSKPNGVCCYPNCDGLHCGDDGCNNGGLCNCDIIPNGRCQSNGRCCYAQDQNYVYCGDDGCGGTRTCHDGSVCSPSGVCSNTGTTNWTYTVLKSDGVQRKNVTNVLDCSGWLPENIKLDLLNFPCKSNDDCPKGDKCVKDSNGRSFCDRNNVYQYWTYDPTDPSGYNCTKILAGSNVCGNPKPGASSFNVLDNHGPDKDACGIACTINPICPPSGANSCCPKDWVQNGNTSYCSDMNGQTQCCLNNPMFSDYQQCLNSGYKSCESIPNVWWKGNKAEITNGVCGVQMNGASVPITTENLKQKEFSTPCVGLYSSNSCVYSDGSTSYNGVCRECLNGKLLCLPERMCVANYTSSSGGGTCSSASVC